MWKFMLILYVLCVVMGSGFAIYNNLVPQAILSLMVLITLGMVCLCLLIRSEIKSSNTTPQAPYTK